MRKPSRDLSNGITRSTAFRVMLAVSLQSTGMLSEAWWMLPGKWKMVDKGNVHAVVIVRLIAKQCLPSLARMMNFSSAVNRHYEQANRA